jgi:archaemetzincin
MIRIITLEPIEDPYLARLTKVLYTAFAVGCEHSGHVTVPAGFTEPYDGNQLLDALPSVRSYADDKLLYITTKKIKDRQLPSGTAPTAGCSRYGKQRALVTTSIVKDLETGMKTVQRNALHQIGHLWELHHCLDPRCAMYPPWTPSFLQGDAMFCAFCRDKSEQKIRLAKS